MSHSNFMKFPIPVVFLATSVLVAGCNSLDNPLSGVNLLGTGRDARVYNAQTGEYEWPKDSQKRRTQRPAPAAAGTASTTTEPERKSDGRYYDPQKSQWVEVQEERTSSPPKPKRPATPPVVLMTTPKPVGTPQPAEERSKRARGSYNASTGQIEWTDFDPPPATKPASEKKKNWYWPF
jgi:hypothetical protein